MATASFTWLDTDDEDTARVREALRAFENPGMIDPLGFGVVRDAFSEILFPGISTIQTRARYFLFVPWLCQALDASNARPSNAGLKLREAELEVLDALLQGESSGETGIIGKNSQRGPNMQLPSAVYWGGLATFGIRHFRGSRRDYLRSVTTRRKEARRIRDKEVGPATGSWHPDLPPAPTDLRDKVGLRLTSTEASFLRTQITTSEASRPSFLAHCLRDDSAGALGRWPWSDPSADAASELHREQLHHAELFSLVVWGANIRYNTLLAEKYEVDGTAMGGSDVQPLAGEWLEAMGERASSLATWRSEWDRMWQIVSAENPRAEARARSFVEWWLTTAIDDPQGAMRSERVAEHLVRREGTLKPGRARLVEARCRRPNEGPQGLEQMVYRWTQVKKIVSDIRAAG